MVREVITTITQRIREWGLFLITYKISDIVEDKNFQSPVQTIFSSISLIKHTFDTICDHYRRVITCHSGNHYKRLLGSRFLSFP